MAYPANGDHASQASIADLMKQLSDQTSRLAQQELALAKVELASKGKLAGVGAGMFGAQACSRSMPSGRSRPRRSSL